MRILTHLEVIWKKFSLYYDLRTFFTVGLRAYLKFWLKSGGYVLPAVVNVELTNQCNLRCKMCVQSAEFARDKGYMSFEMYRALVARTPPESTLFFSGVGEPMLHPQFFEFLQYAITARKNNRIGFTTNGTLITGETAAKIFRSGIRYVQVSMDGVDDVYEEIRGYPYKQIERKIGLLAAARAELRSETKILLNVAVCNEKVYAQMPEIKRRFSGLADMIHFAPLHSLGMLKDFRKTTSRCLQIYFSPMILWNGNINACCSDRENSFNLGNCADTDLAAAFNSEAMKKLRRSFAAGELDPKCRMCGEIVFGKMGKLLE
ncbi:MAG: radical SAM protein [Elusimicrobia bacterium]|nr:radical SAM protein [Elusimicrobiota bacterium]